MHIQHRGLAFSMLSFCNSGKEVAIVLLDSSGLWLWIIVELSVVPYTTLNIDFSVTYHLELCNAISLLLLLLLM